MSYAPDEQYAVYDERRVKARKPHACQACGETIERGHTYWRIGIVHDGARTVIRCERCQAMHVHLRDLGDDTWPEERLDCGESYKSEWGEEPPEEIAALAFALPGEVRA